MAIEDDLFSASILVNTTIDQIQFIRKHQFREQGANNRMFDIFLQPETWSISQEQLSAEVNGIYAGVIMVEAKFAEVVNQNATLAQADPVPQPMLNHEQC